MSKCINSTDRLSMTTGLQDRYGNGTINNGPDAVITLPLTPCMLRANNTLRVFKSTRHTKVSFTSAAAGEAATKYNYAYRRKSKEAVSEKKPSRRVGTPGELVC